MKIKVSLQNSGGELDCRVVDTEEQTREAALDLVSGVSYLSVGDRIVVIEGDFDCIGGA